MSHVRQRSVALILARELAENVTTPMWMWDEEGVLVYFNEPAAAIFGRPFDDVGSMRLDEIAQFQAEDLDGDSIAIADLPSGIALREHRPTHRVLRITAFDGVKRTLSVTAIPLFGRGGQLVGAMTVFWEAPPELEAQ
jgi:PAS domain S-box-containing protein